jgi:hypothetical protein
MNKDEALNLRVPADVKAALKRAAEADDRSVSSMVLRILREWLAATPGPRPRRSTPVRGRSGPAGRGKLG